MQTFDERQELVRRQQEQADAIQQEPLSVPLGSGPGPYQLPQCVRAAVLDGELLLEMNGGQIVLVPVLAGVLPSLARLIDSKAAPGNGGVKVKVVTVPPRL